MTKTIWFIYCLQTFGIKLIYELSMIWDGIDDKGASVILEILIVYSNMQIRPSNMLQLGRFIFLPIECCSTFSTAISALHIEGSVMSLALFRVGLFIKSLIISLIFKFEIKVIVFESVLFIDTNDSKISFLFSRLIPRWSQTLKKCWNQSVYTTLACSVSITLMEFEVWVKLRIKYGIVHAFLTSLNLIVSALGLISLKSLRFLDSFSVKFEINSEVVSIGGSNFGRPWLFLLISSACLFCKISWLIVGAKKL